MPKALVIAEKPSVANDLTRALGRFTKNGDFFENDEYVVASAIGHLIELQEPEVSRKKRGKWTFASLPVLPEKFELHPIDDKADTRFKLLRKLMNRADVAEIINACDAGREGELIFRYLIELAGVRKPIRRLWLQSMTPESIRQAFRRLRQDEEMKPLAQAAFSRAESDWLVGINATRAMTAFNSRAGGFQLTPVGRVQTPTLAILVEREAKIRAFQARAYYEVFGTFLGKAGEYRGRWFDPAFRKGTDEEARAERLWDQASAQAIHERCQRQEGKVLSEEKKPTTQAPPLLYDLTSLQREANNRFGFSARRTLQVAQQLYERLKAITYPRTDSRYLPEDYLAPVKQTLGSLSNNALRAHAETALRNGWVRMNRRVFDDSKVTDHSAIIPTDQAPKTLDEAQQKIYDLIVQRFVAVFFPATQFEVTTRITLVREDHFKTEGRIVKDPGWMIVYGRQATANSEEGEELAAVTVGELVRVTDVEVRRNETRPPPRFSEATLLSTMEGAGKLIEEEELKLALTNKGLGTPATRAAIIEGLLSDGYVDRQGRELYPTAKGISLIRLLQGIGISALCSPELTGEWEARLKRMERGELQRTEFMTQIRGLTREIVEKARDFEGDVEGSYGELDVPCPKCGATPLKEEYRTYRCQSCDYILWKSLAGRQFTPEEARDLLGGREIGPLEGFRSKTGRPFGAKIRLSVEKKPEFVFDSSERGNFSPENFDRTAYPVLHLCPVCKKGEVFELEGLYACERSFGAEKDCWFQLRKLILDQPILRDQALRLITEGRTDLLPRFVSKKGKNRPFAAYLKLEKTKIGFEFPKSARDEAAARAAGTSAPKPASSPRAKKAAPKTARSKAAVAAAKAAPEQS